MNSKDIKRLTIFDFLELTETSKEKYIFDNGNIYLMAGGTHNHNTVCVNISDAIKLDQYSDCIKRNSDQQILVQLENKTYYPDFIIVCGSPQYFDNNMTLLLNPVVLVEVLSPSNKNRKFKKKLEDYALIPSLRELFIVNPNKPYIEIYKRIENKMILEEIIQTLESELIIESINQSIKVSELYRNTITEM